MHEIFRIEVRGKVKKIIFVLGGARSGKSRYAVELSKKLSQKVVFIATATALDREMKSRIRLHRLSRPQEWRVIEEGKDICTILSTLKGRYEIVLIDCLGLLISNLLADDLKDKEIEYRLERLVKAILRTKGLKIIVSNEVGSGIVPDNLLARRFRDLLGGLNQMVAKYADEVIFMQSGIPIVLKGEAENGKIK